MRAVQNELKSGKLEITKEKTFISFSSRQFWVGMRFTDLKTRPSGAACRHRCLRVRGLSPIRIVRTMK